jgi:hypothetical protein
MEIAHHQCSDNEGALPTLRTIRENYTLNRQRAVTQKVADAERDPIVIDHTGGGIVIKFNTGTYECIKRAVLAHYATLHYALAEQGKAVISHRVDGGDSSIDITIKVYRDKIADDQKLYTVNMYNTTNKALVNGKDTHRFISIMDKVAQHLDYKLVNNINKTLQNLCIEQPAEPRRGARQRNPSRKNMQDSNTLPQKGLPQTKCKTKSIKSIKAAHAVRTPGQHNPTQSLRTTTETTMQINNGPSEDNDEETNQCPYCNKNVRTLAALCDICLCWVHYNCDHLNPIVITALENGAPYTCKACTASIDAGAESELPGTMPTGASWTMPTCVSGTM